ncbi:MAG: gliding motility protein GldG [Myxococcaceae bacterium]|nr:gliding motility protein GldG [Myxococcaceae bacterium]
MAMNKRTKRATESVAFLGVIAAIIVLLNVLGIFFFGRADVTENRLFSLSEGSKRVVGNLDDNLEVTAYFTKDLPPPFNATERYVRDILDEYVAASKGKLKVRFVNPDNDDARQQAETDGVQKVAHQKIENDAVQVVEGYRGLVFNYLGEHKAIPAINGTEGLEYDITETLKLLSGERTKIGVLSGHEGPTLAQGLTTLKGLLPTYEVSEVSAATPIDSKVKALLIVSPENVLSDDELRNIDAYVMNGGNLGVFGGSIKIKQDQASLTATPVNSGINRLLEKWGVKMRDEIVADTRCGQAPYRTNFGISIPVAFPPVPVIDFDEKQSAHPVAYRLQQLFLPFSAPLVENGALKSDKDVKLTVIGRTSKDSWTLDGDSIDLKPRDPRQWSRSNDRGPFAIAIGIEGKLPSAFRAEPVTSTEGAAPQGPRGPARAQKAVHIFVTGSSGFVRDEFLPPPQRGGEQELNASVAFGLNAIDWLSQEDELIAVRAKSVEEPLIEVPATVKDAEAEITSAAKQGDEAGAQAALEKRKGALEDWDAKKMRTKTLNVVIVPLLLLLFGLARWQWRKQKRANITL